MSHWKPTQLWPNSAHIRLQTAKCLLLHKPEPSLDEIHLMNRILKSFQRIARQDQGWLWSNHIDWCACWETAQGCASYLVLKLNPKQHSITSNTAQVCATCSGLARIVLNKTTFNQCRNKSSMATACKSSSHDLFQYPISYQKVAPSIMRVQETIAKVIPWEHESPRMCRSKMTTHRTAHTWQLASSFAQ